MMPCAQPSGLQRSVQFEVFQADRHYHSCERLHFTLVYARIVLKY